MGRLEAITTSMYLVTIALTTLIALTCVFFIFLLHNIIKQMFVYTIYEIALFTKLVKYRLPFKMVKEILSAYDTRLEHVFILNYFSTLRHIVSRKLLSNTFD